jgi:hypothetical protein
MGDDGTGDQAGALGQQGDEVLDVQTAVLALAPPLEGRAHGGQGQPGGDVGVVVEVGDDDLAAVRLQRLADGQADHADERGGVHAEADFMRIIGVEEGADLDPSLGDHTIDLYALGVAAATLHVMVDQVMLHRVQHVLRQLGAGGVVEENEGLGADDGGELGPRGLDREGGGGRLD